MTFLILYPAFRFFHETLRGDPRIFLSFGGPFVLSLTQLASVLLGAFAGAAAVLLYPGGTFGAARRRSLSASTPATPSGSE